MSDADVGRWWHGWRLVLMCVLAVAFVATVPLLLFVAGVFLAWGR